MQNASAVNERIKREYFIFLKEAKGRTEASIDGVAKALNRFETYTRFRDFKAFHIEQVKGFKAHLGEQMNVRTGKRLSAATLYSTLGALKAFFQWLAGQPGYKSRISYADAEYFNLSEKEIRIATARRRKSGPTIDQIRRVLAYAGPNGPGKSRPGSHCVSLADVRTRWRDRLLQVETHRLGREENRAGCPRGEDEAKQDVHNQFLPGWR